MTSHELSQLVAAVCLILLRVIALVQMFNDAMFYDGPLKAHAKAHG